MVILDRLGPGPFDDPSGFGPFCDFFDFFEEESVVFFHFHDFDFLIKIFLVIIESDRGEVVVTTENFLFNILSFNIRFNFLFPVFFVLDLAVLHLIY